MVQDEKWLISLHFGSTACSSVIGLLLPGKKDQEQWFNNAV